MGLTSSVSLRKYTHRDTPHEHAVNKKKHESATNEYIAINTTSYSINGVLEVLELIIGLTKPSRTMNLKRNVQECQQTRSCFKVLYALCLVTSAIGHLVSSVPQMNDVSNHKFI